MNYIANLIERLNSDEELPQSGPVKTSSDTVSFQACREVEKINDVALVSEMEEYYKSTKRWGDIKNLSFICSWLIANTGSNEAKEFYLKLKRKGASSNTMMYLIDGALKGNISEYAPYVREMMEIEAKSNCHYSSGIEYLGEVLGKKAVHEIGEILDNDCYGRCEPFYCCFALERIGSKEAIPYLEKAIERNRSGRKKWQAEVVYYSESAIAKINSNPID